MTTLPSVLLTERLCLRPVQASDAEWLPALLNEPGFLRFIGDRGVRNMSDALRYMNEGPLASYARYGFGLLAVERRHDGAKIGLCGLLQREYLEAPDIGYAQLATCEGLGYMREAVTAVLEWGGQQGMARVLAIVNPDNERSIQLLQRCGFTWLEVREIGEKKEPLSVYERCARSA